jgi:hypothetical protein
LDDQCEDEAYQNDPEELQKHNECKNKGSKMSLKRATKMSPAFTAKWSAPPKIEK